jgi:hypothetical protein
MPTITIDKEAKDFRRMPIDFERMGERFKTDNDLFTFPDPTLKTLDENLYFLLRNATELVFKPRYNFKPEYLSYDIYGTPALSQVLMYVNNIGSVEDFVDLPKIVIPSLDAITTILSDIFPAEDIADLQSIDW